MRDRLALHCPGRPAATVTWRDGLVPHAAALRPNSVVTSLRTGRRMRAWRPAERALVIVLDTLPAWGDFRLHPATVDFWHRGVQRKVAPVLWACPADKSGGTFYDWTETHAQAGSGHESMLHDLQMQLQPHGLGYALLRQDDLISPPRVELAIEVRRHALQPVGAVVREHVRREIARSGGLDFHAAMHGEISGLNAEIVCRLVVEGMLRLVPSDRLRPDTRVELSEPHN